MVGSSDGHATGPTSDGLRIAPQGQSGGLVMCVDDDMQCRRIAKEVVEHASHSFIAANSGPECLKLLQKMNPRIILLDVMMPEMDGYEVCRRIKMNFP